MKKIIYSFNYAVAIFPLATALAVAIIYLIGGLSAINENYNPSHFSLTDIAPEKAPLYLLGVLLYTLIFLAIIKVIAYLTKIENSFNYVCKSIVFLMLITFICRFLLFIVMKNGIVPFSDFESVWVIANSDNPNLDYYSLFPSYLNYSVFLKAIVAIAGNNYYIVVITNIILSTITVIAIFLIAHLIVDNKAIANWSGVLYALIPSGISYSLTGTPEFLTIAFNSWGLFFLLLSINGLGEIKYLHAAIGGMLLGIGASYKAFAVIIIIAYTIAVIFQKNDGIKAIQHTKKEKIVSIIMVLLMITIAFVGYKATSNSILKVTEKTYQTSLDYKTATPHFILVGLNTQGEGQIHLGNLSRQYVNRYFENGKDAEEAKEYAMHLLKSDWRNNKGEIPELFLKKVIWAWQDDTRPVVYLRDYNILFRDAKESSAYHNLNYLLLGLSQIYYIFILLFAIIGIITYNRAKCINYRIEVILLLLFGYACLMLLVEAQGRYKCLIMPYICIIAAIGFSSLIEKIRRTKNE